MILTINETGTCWICGRDNQEMTQHHALPKHLKPKHNIIVPICTGCHKRLNIEDLNGMYSYLFKIKRMIGENVGGVNKILKDLDALKEIKESQSINKASLEGKE